VSSTYRLLCLSHDPAIVIDHDMALAEIEALSDRNDTRLAGHEFCDVLAGRFSYPLIEVGCLGIRLRPQAGCRGYHNGINWVDSDWLRLLLASRSVAPAEVLRPFISRCWPLDRVSRLRVELGMTQ
jgi:hypothetical protein